MEDKIYTLIELFDLPEGTIFSTNFDNDNPEFEVWVDNGILCVEMEQGEEWQDNRAWITKEWLQSTFKLKAE